MALDPELLSMMPDSVTIQTVSGRDEWGGKIGGPIIVCPARIANHRRMVLNAAGEQVISETTVYAATTAAVNTGDILTLPSGYLPLQPQIIRVSRVSDEHGLHHTVIYA